MVDLRPTWICQVAWFNAPWDVAPTMIDISAYMRSFSTRRGRADELARFETGTATIVLDNRDGRFYPLPGGPYYPGVVPMRIIRLGAFVQPSPLLPPIYYPIFTGHIESFEYSWSGTADAVCKITAADPFKALAMRQYQWEPQNEQLVTDRLWEAMTGPDAGVNQRRLHIAPGWMNIIGGASVESGSVRISAILFVDQNGTEYGQLLALAEGGRFFCNRWGQFEFHHKAIYWYEPWQTEAMILGEDEAGVEYGYRALEPSYDDSKIVNRSNVLGHGQVFYGENLASQTKYGYRENKWPDMPFEQDIWGQNLAQWLVTAYGEPRFRVRSVTQQPTSQAWWARVLDLEIGRKVNVRRRPPGGGLIEQHSYIEGVNLDVDTKKATIQWILAPSLWEGPWSGVGVYYLDDEANKIYVVGGGGVAPDWHPLDD